MDMHDLDDQDAFNVINITRPRMGNVYIILCGWTDMVTECLIHQIGYMERPSVA